ncbi:MAG: tetratricopeptide repeat protein, partial [Flavobacteriales bacterium]
YIKLSVWPQPLSFVYGYNAVPFNGWLATNTVVAITLIISLVTTALVFSSKKRLIGLGSLIFIVAILPVSNLLYPLEAQIVERGLLIPSIGMCLVMATLLVWLVKKVNLYIGGVIFILVFGGFSTLSFNRIAQWADYETLIQADVSNYPNSAPLQRLNGEFYFLQIPNYDGDERHLLAKKSIRHLIAASKLKSEWAKAHLQLGVLYDREINQPFEALPHFERCLKLKPKSFISAFNIAGCYSQMGMQDSAVYFIKKTLDINPAHFESLEFLTSHYFRRGKIQLGFGFANRFIQMYPQADVPHLIFADYYFKQENESIAVQQLEIASQKNPVNKETLKALFDYYYAKKDFDKAEQYRDIAVYN